MHLTIRAPNADDLSYAMRLGILASSDTAEERCKDEALDLPRSNWRCCIQHQPFLRGGQLRLLRLRRRIFKLQRCRQPCKPGRRRCLGRGLFGQPECWQRSVGGRHRAWLTQRCQSLAAGIPDSRGPRRLRRPALFLRRVGARVSGRETSRIGAVMVDIARIDPLARQDNQDIRRAELLVDHRALTDATAQA